MSTNDPTCELPLAQEHLLLGAVLDSSEGHTLKGPSSYGSPRSEMGAWRDGSALADLCGMSCQLIHGAASGSLVAAAFAGTLPAVGACSFGAVLAGDGSLVSIPLLSHTGEDEWVMLDASPRAPMLEQWLGFLAHIEQDGYSPFEEVTIEDATTSLAPLILWGPSARAVVSDYVEDPGSLPQAGETRDLHLDRIPCLVTCLPIDEADWLLVHVPPARARIVWRSLLSFPVVSPVGTTALAHSLSEALNWPSWLEHVGKRALTVQELAAHGLIRSSGGYVGQRGLA